MTTKTNPLPPLLSDEQIELTFQHHGGNWDGSVWIIEDADLHPFARDLSQQAVREAHQRRPERPSKVEALRKAQNSSRIKLNP